MSRKIVLRSLALIALGLAPAWMPAVAQDAPSVAEAAKRARQQKQDSTKPTKVITNDEIPSAPAPAPAEGSAQGDTKKSAEETAQDEAKKTAEIEALQKQIHQLEHDIDTQKGAIALDENTYYSNPNRPRNSEQKDKIDQEKQALESMQANLADLKTKLEALGVESPAKPPKPPESITSNAPPQS